MSEADRAKVREEIQAFEARVREKTGGRLVIRTRIVTAARPLRTLSGPGPFWISPADIAPILDQPVAGVDSVIAFVKIGEDRGRAVPTRHFGGAYGGDAGLSGACFAAVAFRPRWLSGSGDVLLHEWLHHLDWALTEVGGFDESALPDPDDGRRGPTCCPDAPRGDAAFADHLLERHLSPAMIRAADARRGPAVRDGWLRNWRVDGRLTAGAWRTLTLSRNAKSAVADLPAGTARLRVETDGPVLVGSDGTRVDRETILPAAGSRVVVRPAQKGRTFRVRVRALPSAAR